MEILPDFETGKTGRYRGGCPGGSSRWCSLHQRRHCLMTDLRRGLGAPQTLVDLSCLNNCAG